MKKTRILVVDDDIPLTQILKINLEDTGDFEVRVENQSERAVASAREFQPELILLDIVMPGIDGGDVSALIKAEPSLRNVPILIMTALVSSGETSDGTVTDRGGLTMMAKPVQLDNLIRTIWQQLSKPH